MRLFLLLFFVVFNLFGVESQDKLKVAITGKVAKYISFEDKKGDAFTITVLNSPYASYFDEIYSGKKIKNRDIIIKHIESIDQLEDTDILYIPEMDFASLEVILQKIDGKNILSVSDSKGFAEKGGVLQLYFNAQKIKLRVNINELEANNLKAKSSFLKIADIIKE
jgi:hypothetical protein